MNENLLNYREAILALEDALVVDDKTEAFLQLRNLETLGQSYASVGTLYELGNERIKPDLRLAYEWYDISAYTKNEGDGFFGLARFYSTGRHVEKNLTRAAELHQVALDLGCLEAGISLGYCYLNGCGVSQNFENAEKCLLQAANAGYVYAYYLLSKVKFSQKHYVSAVLLWFRCIICSTRLLRDDPSSAKLYGITEVKFKYNNEE